ncbi:MAG TPA: hypothetical protein DEP45_03925 [Armatimonadetes bacterium]|nr:hypothetical protein [Armatimonadota bacterium]
MSSSDQVATEGVVSTTMADAERSGDFEDAEYDELLPSQRTDVLQAWLKRALFFGSVLMLLLVTFAAKFDTLQGEATLMQADVARNLSLGRGLRSLSVQPLSIALAPEEPDRVLYTPPAYSIILAAALKLFGVSDRAVALVALISLILTIALVFLIALRLFDERVAVGTVALLVITVPLLEHVVSGTEIPFLGLMVTALFGLLLWRSRSERQDSDWWPITASAIAVVCWLTRYEMIVLLPVLGIFWLYGGRERLWRRLLWTFVPFIIVGGLWTVRNSLIVGRPMVSAWSYYLLADTTLYPTTVATRLYEEFASHPWYVATEHPSLILDKLVRYMRQLYYAVPMLGNPFVTAFFFAGVLLASARRELSLAHWMIVLAMAMALPVLCLYVRDPMVLMAFVPVVTLLSVYAVASVADGMVEAPVQPDWDGAIGVPDRIRKYLGISGPLHGSGRAINFALVMLALVSAYPLMDYLFVQPNPQRSPLVGAAQQLAKRQYRILMSNEPEALSWYGGMASISVPASQMQLEALMKAGIKPDAIYLAPNPAAARIRFEGYRRVDDREVPGILWEPLPRNAAPMGVADE